MNGGFRTSNPKLVFRGRIFLLTSVKNVNSVNAASKNLQFISKRDSRVLTSNCENVLEKPIRYVIYLLILLSYRVLFAIIDYRLIKGTLLVNYWL